MRFWYDCEFLENGETIDLISIGMVAEDGRELYLVNEAIDEGEFGGRIRAHNWLMENVVVHLPLKVRPDGASWVDMPGPANCFPRRPGSFVLDFDDNRIVPLRYIRNAVRDFIAAAGPDRAAHELWAYYGAYDHVALCQLFGPMINLPDCIPMWTHDLMQLHNIEAVADMVPQQAEHHALADAKWNREVHRKWKEISRS